MRILWALAVPIKNVVMITTPTFRLDNIETSKAPYVYAHAEHKTVVMPGADIEPLLRRVLEIVIGNDAIRNSLVALGSFDIDTIYQMLTPQDFHTVSRYYAALFQATEFPGGVYTHRPRFLGPSTASMPPDALGLWLRPVNGSPDWMLKFSCSPPNDVLNGMRCFRGNTTDVCYDFPGPGEQRRYEPVDLSDIRVNSGLLNNIGQLYIFEVFHSVVASLFSTKSWKKALERQQYVPNESEALAKAFLSVFKNEVPLLLEKNGNMIGLFLNTLNTTILESCLHAEMVGSYFYTKAFVLDIIQQSLVRHNIFNPNELLIQIPTRTRAFVKPVLQADLFLTSGVRFGEIKSSGRRIFSSMTLTSMVESSMRFKLDKKVNGDLQFGSSIRMLQFMAYYPEYYSHLETSVRDAVDESANQLVQYQYDQFQYSILGGAMSGMNTFKNDWWANTMGVYRLAEVPREPNLEGSAEAPFFLLNDFFDIASPGAALDESPLTRCHRAFYKTLGKFAFVGLLTISQPPAFLVFMSNAEGGAKPWFADTIRRFELYGENIAGKRHAFPFSSSIVARKDDGSAWVTIPLYQAMLDYLGKNQTLQSILAGYNASFSTVMTTEYGWVHFPDTPHCKIGFEKNNVTSDTNTIEKIMAKFYPATIQFFDAFLDRVPSIYQRMKHDLERNGTEMVAIRPESIVGSNSTPQNNGWVGSATFWQPTAFTVGMLKYWPAVTPPAATIALYRNVTRCYRTLELRYLNESVRCWVEEFNTEKTRTLYNSELLRNIVFSNWSISLVLNCIAIVIAARFAWRFVVAWRITRFRCVTIWVALQLNFQGFGVLSFSEIVLLAMSTLPLMFAYHLPADPIFMPSDNKSSLPKEWKDVIVTLSASWFLRLGFELVNHFLFLHYVCFWYNNFRLRIMCIVGIFIARMIIPDVPDNAEYEMWKFVLTIMISMLIGAFCALVPYRAQKHSKISSVRGHKHSHLVVMALSKQHMPLNKHGLLGYSDHGWSVTALIVEGWEVVQFKDREGLFLVFERCRIPLHKDRNGDVKCLL
ncbi:TPA: hypothetical protein N0F65_012054 [Lagenidium giganteum]|uniref:Uncharacterized protein n=1 Tax=Lagenidium giganteum TaxID=4803 RepID=A0AAV2YU82_9STRA|nr:TPA: hypothetical protein N0F65_012054 [Lagenidium giganteum]